MAERSKDTSLKKIYKCKLAHKRMHCSLCHQGNSKLTAMRYHRISIRMVKTQNTTTPNAVGDVEQQAL